MGFRKVLIELINLDKQILFEDLSDDELEEVRRHRKELEEELHKLKEIEKEIEEEEEKTIEEKYITKFLYLMELSGMNTIFIGKYDNELNFRMQIEGLPPEVTYIDFKIFVELMSAKVIESAGGLERYKYGKSRKRFEETVSTLFYKAIIEDF